MSHDKLRIALIGAAGKIAAPCHLNALRNVETIDLVALCDTDESKLKLLGEQYHVGKLYTSLGQVLDDTSIDAVDIVTPPYLHRKMAVAAAQAKKHVYVEKPMAHSVAEATAMVSAADESGVKLMVGESYFFHGPHALAADLIDAGEIGDVLQIRQAKEPWVFTKAENERLQGRGHDVPWRFDPELSGGGEFPWMMDHGSHLFATARRFAQKRHIARVSAIARDHGFGPESHLRGISIVNWVFEGGAVDGVWMHVENESDAGPWIGFRTLIVGTRGSIRVFGEGGGAASDFPQVAPVTLYHGGKAIDYPLDEGPDRSWESNNSYYDQAHTHALGNFAQCILEGQELEYDGRDGQHELTATLATILSACKSRVVELSDVPQCWTAY